MKRLLRTYLPSSSIAFTVVILFNAVYNLVFWNQHAIASSFILQLAGLILLIQLISAACDRIPFQTKRGYSAVFFTLEYLVILAASFLWNRPSMTAGNFLYTTLLFLFIAFLIDRYFAAVHRHEADEINRLLQADEQKKERPL